MRFLLTTLGSSGDINPFIALASELEKRGHETITLVNEQHHAKYEQARLQAIPFGEPTRATDIAEYPDLLHPRKGPKIVWEELIRPSIEPLVQVMREEIDRERPDAIVGHYVAIGSGWVAREARLPWASVLLSPLTWASKHDPNTFPPVLPCPLENLPIRLLHPALIAYARLLTDPACRRLQRELGFEVVKRSIELHSRRADMHLGLWSPQLRPPAIDDPRETHITGACVYDAEPAMTTKRFDIERAMTVDEGDPKPVIVALGSVAVHLDRAFFEIACDAARGLDRRVVMLIGDASYEPSDLPENVVCLDYAPFSQVFPRASGVVIHGGAGSTHQAVRAGVPTLLTPVCNDQFDFAARCVKLGVARSVPRHGLSAKVLRDELQALLASESITRRAERVAELEALTDGPALASHHLEQLVERSKKDS